MASASWASSAMERKLEQRSRPWGAAESPLKGEHGAVRAPDTKGPSAQSQGLLHKAWQVPHHMRAGSPAVPAAPQNLLTPTGLKVATVSLFES